MPNKAVPLELKRKIGKAITTLIERDGITQYRLAQELTLTESAISKTRNAINAPALDTLIEIADYFNVSTDFLLGRTGDASPFKPESDSKTKQ